MKRYILLAILMMAAITACTSEKVSEQNTGQNTAPSSTVYFSMSDPGDVLEGVSSILLTVSKMSIHNQGTDAWVDVSASEFTVELMELKASQLKTLVAEANLTPGRYNQVRIDVLEVLVTYNGKEEAAKLPSNVLRINVDLTVENEESLINFDFLANESLHIAGNGKIVMAPVLRVEKYRDAEIEKKGRNIEARNPKEKEEKTVGMDEKGEIGEENRIEEKEDLEVDDSGNVVKTVRPENNNTGRAIITVKDKSDNNQSKNDNNQSNKPVRTSTGLVVTSLKLTFSNLSVHKAGNGSWISFPLEQDTFDLIELQDAEAILGDTQLEPGQYTQIRLDISNAVAVINNNTVNVTVPSKTLKLVGVLKIDEDSVSVATIDFLVNKSLHQAGSQYYLKPVIKLSTKSKVTIKEIVTKEKDQEDEREEIEYDAENVTEEEETSA